MSFHYVSHVAHQVLDECHDVALKMTTWTSIRQSALAGWFLILVGCR
jgi:hypothetical protein